MSDYRLRYRGDPILREKALGAGDEIIKLVPAMKRILAEQGGQGLAAQQVGSTCRVALCRFGRDEEPTVCINLSIVARSREVAVNRGEGCLSWPEKEGHGTYVRVNVRRHKRVFAEWQDESGDVHSRWLSGMDAIVAQHECDHLNGICIADRAAA